MTLVFTIKPLYSTYIVIVGTPLMMMKLVGSTANEPLIIVCPTCEGDTVIITMELAPIAVCGIVVVAIVVVFMRIVLVLGGTVVVAL